MQLEISNKKTLGLVFSALATEEKLRALELFGQRKELSQIAELVGMSRSGFQKVVDTFRKLGMIERDGHRSYYKLSHKGQRILEMAKDFSEKLKPLEEEEAKRELEALTSVISINKIEEILEKMKEEKKSECENC